MLYMHGMHEFKLQKDDSIDLKYKLWHTVMNCRWKLFYWCNKKNFCQYDTLIDIHESSAGISYMRKLGSNAVAHIITNAVEDFDGILVSEDDCHNYPVLEETFFLNVSNFNPRKNQLLLVEAFHNILEKHNSKLVLIGGMSDYCEAVKKQIKEYSLEDQVLVYENQERIVTRKFIKNCFCSVMSSRFEVYPIFLCEAISCSHPYISTDVGCVRGISGGGISLKYRMSFPKLCRGCLKMKRIEWL